MHLTTVFTPSIFQPPTHPRTPSESNLKTICIDSFVQEFYGILESVLNKPCNFPPPPCCPFLTLNAFADTFKKLKNHPLRVHVLTRAKITATGDSSGKSHRFGMPGFTEPIFNSSVHVNMCLYVCMYVRAYVCVCA